jgi:glycerophosphoryl diester phosphodiesterase
VYPEIKRPAWHHAEGVDVSAGVLQTLADFGYTDAADPVFVQCFDAGEVARLRHDLGCRMRLVQLIGDNSWGESDTDYDELRSAERLETLSRTVDAIGPWLRQLYTVDKGSGSPVSTGLVETAHEAGLLVHPYTFRSDDIPDGFRCFEPQGSNPVRKWGKPLFGICRHHAMIAPAVVPRTRIQEWTFEEG